MNHYSSPPETMEYPHSSSMSEGDSLSDSDWLDISSNRESDDNDSLMSGDSEREGVRMPLSRRSSISVGSSRDGDVEAWEGFVEDSGDEEVSFKPPAATISDPTAVAIESSMGASELTASIGHDPAEEQRVKDALDQSLISTLSGSRSSAGSTNTSIRDLRLSFPDPLTSPRDELNGSYEDVSPSKTDVIATDVATDNAVDAGNATTDFPDMPLCKEDPGSISSTPVVAEHEVPVYPEDNKFGFDIVLYGSSSPNKWSFVQTLVQKAVLVNDITVTDMMTGSDERIRYLHLQSKTSGPLRISHWLPIHDRTESDNAADAPNFQALVNRPSLAILYLPAAVQVVPDHTLYLPVLVPSTSPATDDLSRAKAVNDWKALSIPPNKVARLGLGVGSPIFDGRDIGEVQDLRAHRLFQRLLCEMRKRPVKFLPDRLGAVHAVTLFALMSLIFGFTMNTAFRRSSVLTPTTSSAPPPSASTLWGSFGPEVNTSASATTARANAPAVTTHKDFSLSIFNPGTTSLSITSYNKRPQVASASSAAQVQASHSKPSTGTDMARSAEDTLSSETKLPTDTKTSMVVVPSAFKFEGPSGSKSTALSLVVDSLSEVLDVRVARLRNDLDELIESLDELGRAISRQTKKRVDLSKGKAREFRERVQYRHDRARGRAKELKKKGEEIIYSAGEHLIGRTKVAKQRARDLTTNLAKTEVGRAYQKAHAEWVAMLKDKGGGKEKGGEGGQAGRRNGMVKCKKRGNSASTTNFISWSYAELYLA
ncbi:hypothetical protein LshimejAT787_0803220 [Lyophyllum shimeji]|uniref:Uncharacterized protein n=1 Tax=Lyophyllum shimeji TaxID=47721 RepID=A0A9P3URR0_LYOSH|nr:hypothetical protein LshimejAT787_0803220 [Lyophyllum shimeji]